MAIFTFRHTDYIALFMRDGRLVYAFNCGSGAVFAESEMPFNDGLWHNATFSRVGNRGSLKVDQVSNNILSIYEIFENILWSTLSLRFNIHAKSVSVEPTSVEPYFHQN